jgi:endogenous inhibitor of DNA gyrase (YacG/DUF329 family)
MSPATAKCPQCGKPAPTGADNPWRPFCSERCKLGDLGQWFAGKYAIADDTDQESTVPEDPKPPQ